MAAPRSLALLPCLLLAACGGSSPPPPAAPADGVAMGTSPPNPGAPKAEAAPSAAPKADTAGAEQCLAAANAKRAKFTGEPAKVSVRHILVKYKGAKNPVASVTRTREEACLRAVEARDKLRQGAEWDAVVKEYSDDPGASTRGGTLGSVERKDLQKPFADAAFELSVNMLSDVVETESGFHLIFRFE